MRTTVLALALFGFSLTACDNPPPIVNDVAEESDQLDAASEGQDSASSDAAQPD